MSKEIKTCPCCGNETEVEKPKKYRYKVTLKILLELESKILTDALRNALSDAVWNDLSSIVDDSKLLSLTPTVDKVIEDV